MGAAIAARLLDRGPAVIVWNRTADKTRALAAAGAAVAATPQALSTAVDCIITMLTDAAAIEATYQGQSGLLAGKIRGKLFIDMSTVRPEVETALAAKVSEKGAALIECPVGGTVGPAKEENSLVSSEAMPATWPVPNRSSTSSVAASSTSERSARARA